MKILAIAQQFTTQLHIEFGLIFLRNILHVTLYVKRFILIYNAVLYTLSQKSPLYRRNHFLLLISGY